MASPCTGHASATFACNACLGRGRVDFKGDKHGNLTTAVRLATSYRTLTFMLVCFGNCCLPSRQLQTGCVLQTCLFAFQHYNILEYCSMCLTIVLISASKSGRMRL